MPPLRAPVRANKDFEMYAVVTSHLQLQKVIDWIFFTCPPLIDLNKNERQTIVKFLYSNRYTEKPLEL